MGSLDWANLSIGIRNLFELAGLIVRHRPDVVLLTASQGKLALMRDALMVLIARGLRRRVVTYLRGGGYASVRARQGWAAGRALRYILKASARVIVLGDNLIDMVRAVYPAARVAVVPNGCPQAVPPGAVGSRQRSRPLVLYIGALSRTKGIDDLLHAAGAIVTSVPSAEMIFCGEWSPAGYQKDAMDLVGRLDLAEFVAYPGPVTGEEKAALLARAWVLVVPSHSEGQPWVILEAMSAGVPVIATDTGAIARTVQDATTGFVIPVGDRNALADRVVTVVQDDELWSRMSRESVERYRDLFTVEQSHDALASVLEQVARGE
jgi:glycosyltransferase involved in cell wall biosynthesis